MLKPRWKQIKIYKSSKTVQEKTIQNIQKIEVALIYFSSNKTIYMFWEWMIMIAFSWLNAFGLETSRNHGAN